MNGAPGHFRKHCTKTYGKHIYYFQNGWATAISIKGLFERKDFGPCLEDNGVPYWKQIRAMLRRIPDHGNLSVANSVGYPATAGSLLNWRKLRSERPVKAAQS